MSPLPNTTAPTNAPPADAALLRECAEMFESGDVLYSDRETDYPTRLRALADQLERERYDPMRHRDITKCSHAISETCGKCHCPTCGQPVVVMSSGPTSFYVPLPAVLASLADAPTDPEAR